LFRGTRSNGVIKIETHGAELFQRLAGELVGPSKDNTAPFFNDDVPAIRKLHTARSPVSILLRNPMDPPIRWGFEVTVGRKKAVP
jgi:hypothetical protein